MNGAAAEAVSDFEQKLGYAFRQRELLERALTHKSFSNENRDSRAPNNERLEFLGDAILGFVVCDLLFQQFPQYLEGELTKIKSVVVSRQTCAKISEAPMTCDVSWIEVPRNTPAAVALP